MAAGHKTLVPALKKALTAQGGNDILLVAGGVIPHDDYSFLLENGASLIFGPGSKVTDASNQIIAMLEKNKSK